MRSTDQGRSWARHSVPGSLGQVHMSIVTAPDGSLVALFRSRWADNIHLSRSHDDGATWSVPEATPLPNNNSSIQATDLAGGGIALVYNPSSAAQATARRVSLYDELDDAGPPSPASRADDGSPRAFWGAPRAPLRLNWSHDGGRTWAQGIDLETGDGFCMTNNSLERLNRELSYPTVHQSADGALHVAFTYHRRSIEHVRIAPDALRMLTGAEA
jgi:predicted neuraminidase